MQSRRFRNAHSWSAPLIALGVLTASVSPAAAAETSIFIAYSKPGHTGTQRNINGCGPHNMPYPVGSYEWVARGQSGKMYNVSNAAGVSVATLASDTNASSSRGVGWKSIFIVC